MYMYSLSLFALSPMSFLSVCVCVGGGNHWAENWLPTLVPLFGLELVPPTEIHSQNLTKKFINFYIQFEALKVFLKIYHKINRHTDWHT